jgi:ATP-dependent helicase HrpB
MAFCHRRIGEPWPDVSDAALTAGTDWLEPWWSRARRRADVERLPVGQALRNLLPWQARIDEAAPEALAVPSGREARVDYSGETPVLAVKLQEMFGAVDTPRIADVPVLLHLLSPAGRPLAVTADLRSFWEGPYQDVRKEMRGRYPKHPWPEDPYSVAPTAKVKRHLRSLPRSEVRGLPLVSAGGCGVSVTSGVRAKAQVNLARSRTLTAATVSAGPARPQPRQAK